MDYQLHLRITTVGSPTSGQPHAGGPGAGDVIVDQIIDLRQWVAERGGLAPVVEPAPVVDAPLEVVAPAKPTWTMVEKPVTQTNTATPLRFEPVTTGTATPTFIGGSFGSDR